MTTKRGERIAATELVRGLVPLSLAFTRHQRADPQRTWRHYL
jgi:hypothetical protein